MRPRLPPPPPQSPSTTRPHPPLPAPQPRQPSRPAACRRRCAQLHLVPLDLPPQTSRITRLLQGLGGRSFSRSASQATAGQLSPRVPDSGDGVSVNLHVHPHSQHVRVSHRLPCTVAYRGGPCTAACH
eukprot:320909-Chlamydomonas_euryale.AAC.6